MADEAPERIWVHPRDASELFNEFMVEGDIEYRRADLVAAQVREANGVNLLLHLYRQHMYAARDKREVDRHRLFALIDEFRWAFPDIAADVDRLYPEDKPDA